MSPPVNKSRLKEYIKNEMMSRRRRDKLSAPRALATRRSNSSAAPLSQEIPVLDKPAKRGVRQILEEASLLKGGRLSRLIKKARERKFQWKTNFVKRRHSWGSMSRAPVEETKLVREADPEEDWKVKMKY